MKKTNNHNCHPGVIYSLAVARLSLGFVFLWAFFDKLFGLGIATPAGRAWVQGGSPTSGFLSGVGGPFQELFAGLVGIVWVDWLFMLGLLGIGLALILGIGLRIAAFSGSLLMVTMWAASLPLKSNPIIDDHLVYATILTALAFLDTHPLSLRPLVSKIGFVKKNRWLL